MKTTFLLLCGLTASVSAFVVVTPGRSCCCRVRSALGEAASSSSNVENNDDARLLSQIQHDYKKLQEKLLCDIVLTHDGDQEALQETEERMIELAARAAALQRYRVTRALDGAERHLAQAVDDIYRARAVKDAAHSEAAQVERDEAALLESSTDDAAGDRERLRDQAVVHADHQLEEDAEILEFQGEYHRELAEQEEHTAARLLRRLDDYEHRLKDVLKEMRSFRASGQPYPSAIHKEVVKQQKFLDSIKWVIDSDESLLDLRQKLAPVQEHWQKEWEHLQQMEHAVHSDPDLANVVRDDPSKTEHINPKFMELESHVHDSLLNEIQHAIDTDADLRGVTSRDQKAPQAGYMEREQHKHDSVLNEIEHSIATDPDLAT